MVFSGYLIISNEFGELKNS